jgi:diguanylate cyclase (GGDEF)-like protein/PAS domain S-box-containing protein
MEALAQLSLPGFITAVGREFLAQFVFRLPAGRQDYIYWIALAVLICLSAAAGALIYRLCSRAGIRRRDGESTVGELAMLRAVVNRLPSPIFVKDSESHFLFVNQATADTKGLQPADLLGKTDFDFFPEEIAAGFLEDERKILLSGQPQISKEEYIKEPNGRTRCNLTTKVPLPDAAGQTIGIIGISRNISALKDAEAELKRVRDELAFKAAHDYLTSLMNRGAILEMLDRELARNIREDGSTAVLLGDLDHFKNINDTLGHPTGDEVLREVACRLMKAVRPYDLVGRFGGEEFLVVLPGCAAPDALARADQLREAIAASPIPTARGPIHITISVGVIVSRDWGQPTAEEILREVDSALYAAKAAGRNRCSLAVPPCNDRGLG